MGFEKYPSLASAVMQDAPAAAVQVRGVGRRRDDAFGTLMCRRAGAGVMPPMWTGSADGAGNTKKACPLAARAMPARACGCRRAPSKHHETPPQVGSPTYSPFPLEAVRHRLTPWHYAYLRVAEGCNHACTFCAIPGFRGKFRSKPPAEVLAEAGALVAAGALELNLVAGG